MKITIETPNDGEEEEIIIRCHNMNERVMELIAALKNNDIQMTGYLDERIVKLVPKDIYYFESVDNKVFAYTQKEVYEVRKKLYEIENEFIYTDFLRISKSIIVNLSKIKYITPILNGKYEARLKNEEKIIISRQYMSDLKQKLGI